MGILLVGCNREPPIFEYPSFVRLPYNEQVAGVPVILVGRILSCSPNGSPHPSRWDGRTLMQMFKLDVRVENILQGDLAVSQVSVFYFMNTVASEGPARLGLFATGGTWHTGDREMFFLQRDSGVLRTICDTWRNCVIPIHSGSHSPIKRGPNTWIGDSIAHILLTRGEGCSDMEMIQALSEGAGVAYSFSPNTTIRELQQTAAHETPPVRHEACEALGALGHPCLAPNNGKP